MAEDQQLPFAQTPMGYPLAKDTESSYASTVTLTLKDGTTV